MDPDKLMDESTVPVVHVKGTEPTSPTVLRAIGLNDATHVKKRTDPDESTFASKAIHRRIASFKATPR
jgi:hypothetical protein